MFARVRAFLARHPLVRDALIWAIPAIAFGAILRLLFLSYYPYAYWGSDSKSYFSFAHKLTADHYISLDEKRRFLYPILLAPVALLPGATLKWVAWLQHLLGLATLVPLAYICRRTLVNWRVLLIPVTVLYAGLPMILWYEHELLGENVFFATLMWTFAGWVAWVSQEKRERAQRYFWWFFVPLALFILTKPSGRFVWPGIAVALLFTAAWRRLTRKQWIALAALVAVTLTVGSKKQGAWLLYVATFPLTQLDTPLHAEYKAQIRDLVEEQRNGLDTYYEHDDFPFAFLENPSEKGGGNRPLWSELDKDRALRSRIYTDLALEGIRKEPLNFLFLGWQRIVASINPAEFKETRFTANYYRQRFPDHYQTAQEAIARGRGTPIPELFGFPPKKPLPPYDEFLKRVSPAPPDTLAERTVVGWVKGVERYGEFVKLPDDIDARNRDIRKSKLLPLGWWLVAGMLISLIGRYWKTLGMWTIIAWGYLFGVFLFAQANPRYLCPAWVVMIVLLAVPADGLIRLLRAAVRRQPATGS